MRRKRRPGVGDTGPKQKGRTKRSLINEIAESEQAHFLSVYDGQTCIGFLLLRGRNGVEAFNADTKSLGLFVDQRSAADAISKAAVSS